MKTAKIIGIHGVHTRKGGALRTVKSTAMGCEVPSRALVIDLAVDGIDRPLSFWEEGSAGVKLDEFGHCSFRTWKRWTKGVAEAVNDTRVTKALENILESKPFGGGTAPRETLAKIHEDAYLVAKAVEGYHVFTGVEVQVEVVTETTIDERGNEVVEHHVPRLSLGRDQATARAELAELLGIAPAAPVAPAPVAPAPVAPAPSGMPF